eukprot:c8874_g1_i1 orf=275-1843(+)
MVKSNLSSSDCDSSFEGWESSIPIRSSCSHIYTYDRSSNSSYGSSSIDNAAGGGNVTSNAANCENGVPARCSNSKPHKAHDTAWSAIRELQLKDGNIGLKNFKMLHQVGQGDIGSVYLTQLRGTDYTFAIKVMDKEALGHRNKLKRMHTEREILERVDHPFLPTLYAHFNTDKFSCLVMDFCPGGDLHSLRQYQRAKRFGSKAARFYAAEVLVALEYLHMMGIVYRDLKPENVLVGKDGHIMLTDFDLCLKCVTQLTLQPGSTPSRRDSGSRRPWWPILLLFRSFTFRPRCPSLHFLKKTDKVRSYHTKHPSKVCDSKSNLKFRNVAFTVSELIAEPTNVRSMSFVGTHEYLAPEIIAGYGHGSAVDWWTFGIFLYELLFGWTPFKGSSNDDTLLNIVTQPLKFPVEADTEVGHSARSLLEGLLTKDPQMRLGSVRGATEIKQHPFFRSINWALIRCAKPPEIPKINFKVPRARKQRTIQKTQHGTNDMNPQSNASRQKRSMWNISRTNTQACSPTKEFDCF